jgi:hypothetical protein
LSNSRACISIATPSIARVVREDVEDLREVVRLAPEGGGGIERVAVGAADGDEELGERA